MRKAFSLIFIIFLAFYTTNCSQEKDIGKKDQTTLAENENVNYQTDDYEIKSPDQTVIQNEEQNIEHKKALPPNSMTEPILPDWAKEIGITLPEGLTFVPELSIVSEFNPDLKTVNSINLVFSGPLEKSLKEAEKIAKKANVPPSEDFVRAREEQRKHQQMLLAQGQKVEFPELKGMIYSNTKPDPKVLESLKYIISIIVEENGNLVINVVDNEQSKKLFK